MAGPLRVVVTGASSGIGAAIARSYARRGAHVGLLARRRENLEAVAAACRSDGGEAVVLVADVTSRDEVGAAFDDLARRWPRLDRAILNAGFARGDGARAFTECCTSDEQNAGAFNAALAERIMSTNYFGTVLCLERALAWMREGHGGRIAFTGSMADVGLVQRSGPYVASKTAVRALVDGLRPDACALGIGLTLLEPGFVDTQMTEDGRFRAPFQITSEQAAEAFVAGIEAGRKVVRAPWRMAAFVQVMKWIPAPLRIRGATWFAERAGR